MNTVNRLTKLLQRGQVITTTDDLAIWLLEAFRKARNYEKLIWCTSNTNPFKNLTSSRAIEALLSTRLVTACGEPGTREYYKLAASPELDQIIDSYISNPKPSCVSTWYEQGKPKSVNVYGRAVRQIYGVRRGKSKVKKQAS